MNKITAIHIFDFDGTLVDSSHRYRTDASGNAIDLQYWIKNEHLAHLDKPIKAVCNLFKSLCESANDYALIATARIWCDGADKVCKSANIKPDSLVSRNGRDDCRGGAELKIAHVNRLLNLKQFSEVKEIHVYEDNLTYLKKISDFYYAKGYSVKGHYYPSNQGF